MYKCQSNGKIEYSDKPCVTGSQVKRIAPNGGPTPEDRAQAVMRQEAERARFDAQDEAAARERVRSANATTKRIKDAPGEQAAKQDDEKVLIHRKDGWDRKPKSHSAAKEAAKQDARERARLEAPANSRYDGANPGAEPNSIANITSCNPGGCFDTLGRHYMGSGPTTMIRADGKVCQRVGQALDCN